MAKKKKKKPIKGRKDWPDLTKTMKKPGIKTYPPDPGGVWGAGRDRYGGTL